MPRPDFAALASDIEELGEAAECKPIRLCAIAHIRCDKFLDRFTGTRKMFLAPRYQHLRNTVVQIAVEAEVDYNSMSHLFNLIRKIRADIREPQRANPTQRARAIRFLLACDKHILKQRAVA